MMTAPSSPARSSFNRAISSAWVKGPPVAPLAVLCLITIVTERAWSTHAPRNRWSGCRCRWPRRGARADAGAQPPWSTNSPLQVTVLLKLTEIYQILRRDNSLTQAMERSLVMVDRTKAMFGESVSALRHGDARARRLDIYEEDQRVNEYQQEVRRKVFQHLAVTGGLNLKSGLILTSIVIDIERIGDYTKNITELADAHPGKLDSGRYDPDIRRIEEAVAALFEGTVRIVRSGNAEGARAIIRDHLWIKRRCDDIARDLAATAGADLSQSDAVTTALYARYLKRVGSHLMNILSSVINPFDKIGYRDTTEDAVGLSRQTGA